MEYYFNGFLLIMTIIYGMVFVMSGLLMMIHGMLLIICIINNGMFGLLLLIRGILLLSWLGTLLTVVGIS